MERRIHLPLLLASLGLVVTAATQQPPSPVPSNGQPHQVRVTQTPESRLISAGVTSKSLNVAVQIEGGVATTTLTQVFHNGGPRPAEATWLLPLPKGAAPEGFRMTMGGKLVSGEVLDAGKARHTYERIVRQMKDPGILEYMGRGALRARVFPIPPGGDMTVEVGFAQVLEDTAGLFEWGFAMRAPGLMGLTPKSFVLDVHIVSAEPLQHVYSPLPQLYISRKGDHEARLSMELSGSTLPPADPRVFFSLADREFGVATLFHRPESQDDATKGSFLMLLSPRRGDDLQPRMDRTVQFVLDVSGSMRDGDKMEQARGALRRFVKSLAKGDHFNVVPFSHEALPFFPGPVPADETHVKQALEKIAALEPQGGTNIDAAVRYALQAGPAAKAAGRLPLVVFLTDGEPTIGTTQPKRLLASLEAADPEQHSRVFVFGVGHDVNALLLDRIAEQHKGARDYVRPGEDIEVKTAALFEKLVGPVLTDATLTIEGAGAVQLEPGSIPDLFAGSTLRVLGRYTKPGHHLVTLKGRVGSQVHEFTYEVVFPDVEADHDELPALWAQRRIARLLDAIRLHGRSKELVDEVRHLGTTYGIVTPFTSHLVLESRDQLAQRVRPMLELDDQDAAEDVRRLRRENQRRGVDVNGRRPPVPGVGGGAGGPAGQANPRSVRPSSPATGSRAPNAPAETKGWLTGQTPEAETATVREDVFAGLGVEAIDESQQIDSARAADRLLDMDDASRAGLSRHRIGTRLFLNVGGVWVDQKFSTMAKEKVQDLVLFSAEYFGLLQQHKELAKVFAFSTRMVVVVGDMAYRLVAAPPKPPQQTPTAGDAKPTGSKPTSRPAGGTTSRPSGSGR